MAEYKQPLEAVNLHSISRPACHEPKRVTIRTKASSAASHSRTELSRNLRHVCFSLHVRSSFLTSFPHLQPNTIQGLQCCLNVQVFQIFKDHKVSEDVEVLIILLPKPWYMWTCLIYPRNAHRGQAFFSFLTPNRSRAFNYISESPTSDLWELFHFQFH